MPGQKLYLLGEWRVDSQKSTDTRIGLINQHPEFFAEVNAQRDPQRRSVVQDYFASLGQFKGLNKVALAAHGEPFTSAGRQKLR